MSENLPSFVCVGGPKCGTTSLYHYLRDHPEVFLPAQKELHFFSAPDLLERPNGPGMRSVLADIVSSEAEYRKMFRASPKGAVSGDISPSYLTSTVAPQAIKDLLGSPKIIIMLRDPVDRMFSQYMHLRRSAREDLEFEDALAAEPARLAQGWGDMWLYRNGASSAEAVERYFDTFGKENVMVILAPEMRADTRGVMKQVMDFIGVDSSVELDLEGEFNKSGMPKSKVIARLIDASPLATFAKRVIPRGIGASIKRRIQEMNTGPRLILSQEKRDEYRAEFAEDTRKLEALIGRSTGWLDQTA